MESIPENVIDLHQQQQQNGKETTTATSSSTTTLTSHSDEMSIYEQQRRYPQHDNVGTSGSQVHAVSSAGSQAHNDTNTNAFPSGLSALIMAATSQLNYLADAACSREKEEEQIVITTSTQSMQHQHQPNGMMLTRNELDSRISRPILHSHNERNYTNTNSSSMEPSSSSIGFDQSNRLFQNRTQSSNYFHHPSHRSASVQKSRATTGPSTSSTGTAIPPNETTPTIMPESVPTRKLTFPETLMTLAIRSENIDTITFLPDGKFFAIRPDTFVEQILLGNCLDSFLIHTYDRFLDVLSEWGYTSVLDPVSTTDIAVFRHPQFIKGEWELCRHMHSSTDHAHTVRFQSLNEYRGIDGHITMSSSTTDDSASTSVSTIGLQQHQQPHHPTTFRPSIATATTNYSSHHTTDGNNTSDDGSSQILDSDHCQNASTTSSTTSHPKRRLSPSSSVARPDSISSVLSQKQKIESEEEVHSDVSSIHGRRATHSIGSVDESETVAGTSAAGSDDTSSHLQGSSYCTNQLDDAVRSKALAITTDKLQLHHQTHSRRNSLVLGSSRNDTATTDVQMDDMIDCKPQLIDQAVSSATHSIVTNAIATLLRDESHTKETYLKHEKELSKSCIPGVIPISTQLFSPGLTEPLTTAALRSTSSLTSIRRTSNEEDIPNLNRSATLPFTSSANSHFVPTSHRANVAMRRNSLHSYDPTSYQRMSSSTPGDFIHSTTNSTPLANYPSSNLASSGVEFSHLRPIENGTLHRRTNNSDVATRRSSLPIRTSPSSNELSLNDQVAGIESLMNLKHHFSSGHVRGLSASSSLGGSSTRTYLPNFNSGDITATTTSTPHRTAGITDHTTTVEGQSISRTVTGDLHFLRNSS